MRVEQLTFTRFIAAFLIVVLHFGLTAYPFNCLVMQFVYTNVWVSYFFVLSGFVMVVAYGKHQQPVVPFTYYKNRLARVYPVYMLAFVAVLYCMYLSHIPIVFKAVALDVSVLQSWFPGYPLTGNRPGWTLSVEVFFYAIFPWLFNYWYRKQSITTIAVIVVSVWLVSQMVSSYFAMPRWNTTGPTPNHDLLYYFPLIHLNQFLMGNLFGLLYFNLYAKYTQNWNWLVLVTAVVMLLLLKFPIPHANYHNGFLAIIFAFFILIMALNNGAISKALQRPWLVFLGEISFGMYILQIPVFTACFRLARNQFQHNYSTFFAFFMVVLMIVSGLSYQFVEMPLRKWIRNW